PRRVPETPPAYQPANLALSGRMSGLLFQTNPRLAWGWETRPYGALYFQLSSTEYLLPFKVSQLDFTLWATHRRKVSGSWCPSASPHLELRGLSLTIRGRSIAAFFKSWARNPTSIPPPMMPAVLPRFVMLAIRWQLCVWDPSR